jgi:hypothetical protein
MPSTTHTKATPKTNISPTPDHIKAAAQACDMATLGRCCIGEIRSFLRALEILSRNLKDDDVVIHDLAKLGLRFADDHHNLLDLEAEEKNATLNALLSGADHA